MVVTTQGNLAFSPRASPSSVVTLPFPTHLELPPDAESADALLPYSHGVPPCHVAALGWKSSRRSWPPLPTPPLVLVSDFFLRFKQPRPPRHVPRHVSLLAALCFSLARRVVPRSGIPEESLHHRG
ncbi:unnamed protein product [Urochloa humidicola]